MPIGIRHYDDWVRRLEAKGWNRMSKEEMQWYRSLTAQQEEVKRLERQLRDAQAERAAERALPECEISWCSEISVNGVYCKRCKGNLESWGIRTSKVPTGPTGRGKMSLQESARGGGSSSGS